jgi:hypothetical protein
MGLGILATLMFLYLPFALASIAGERVCRWTNLLGTLYFTSQTVWSFFIAIYRVLYIKFQSLFKNGIKETTFVFFLSNVGFLYIALSGMFFAFYDRGLLYKLCTHYSIQQIEILDVSNSWMMCFFCYSPLCVAQLLVVNLDNKGCSDTQHNDTHHNFTQHK